MIGQSSGFADVEIARELARADAVLALRCGFGRDDAATPAPPTFASQSYTFLLNGDAIVSDDGRTLQLPVWPVTSVTSIQDDPTEAFNGTSYLVASTDYTLARPARGQVLLKQTATHGVWYDTDQRTKKVVFIAGWTDATMPEDIKRAITLQVATWFNARTMAGVQGASLGSHASASPTTTAQDVSPEALRILAPRRCWRTLT